MTYTADLRNQIEQLKKHLKEETDEEKRVYIHEDILDLEDELRFAYAEEEYENGLWNL